MRTSIAMTTFNGERHLRAQLASFLSQTLLVDELVVCDDSSTDGTVAILEEFAREAPFPVRLHINERNLGYTQNFAKALAYTSGEVVLIADQDDVWFRGKIEAVVGYFRRHPGCWIVIHDGDLTDELLRPTGSTKLVQIRRGYGTDSVACTGCLTAVRRELLDMALPVPEHVRGHDVWIHALGKAIPGGRGVLEESLQYLRRHGNNASEWVVNKPSPISRIDVLLSQLKTKTAESYADQLLLNQELQTRLDSCIGSLPNPVQRAALDYVQHLRKQRSALERRQQLVAKRRLSRMATSVDMLFQGQYTYFNGIYSFLRDVLR